MCVQAPNQDTAPMMHQEIKEKSRSPASYPLRPSPCRIPIPLHVEKSVEQESNAGLNYQLQSALNVETREAAATNAISTPADILHLTPCLKFAATDEAAAALNHQQWTSWFASDYHRKRAGWLACQQDTRQHTGTLCQPHYADLGDIAIQDMVRLTQHGVSSCKR